MRPDRDRIRSEIGRLPIDPEPTPPLSPHPVALVRRDADLLPVIAVGGALGSLARWGMAQVLPSTGFAWSTLLTNVIGCGLIGVLMALMVDRWSGTRYVRPFLGVGVLGGFTTFSTYELETRGLLAAGRPGLALAYLAGSVAAGLLAVTVGVVAGRAALRGRRTTAGAER